MSLPKIKNAASLKIKVPKHPIIVPVIGRRDFVSSKQEVTCSSDLKAGHPIQVNDFGPTTDCIDSVNCPVLFLNGSWMEWFNKHSQLDSSQTLISQKFRFRHIFPVDVRNKGWNIHSCHRVERDLCVWCKHIRLSCTISRFSKLQSFKEGRLFWKCLFLYLPLSAITPFLNLLPIS